MNSSNIPYQLNPTKPKLFILAQTKAFALIFSLIALFFVAQANAGTWGYGPKDSDTALDVLEALEDKSQVNNILEGILDVESIDESAKIRAACHYIVTDADVSKIPRINEFVISCLKKLGEMASSEQYLTSWSKPDIAAVSISSEIAMMNTFDPNKVLQKKQKNTYIMIAAVFFILILFAAAIITKIRGR